MTAATGGASLLLLFELPFGAQPMVKLASMGAAFIDPDQVGAFPDLVVFGSVAYRNGGWNITWDVWIRTPARFSRRVVGH